MVRTNQGGSVLSFVIVGVILVGLAVGGVYFVRQQTAQPEPAKQQPVAVNTPSEDKEKEAEKARSEASRVQAEEEKAKAAAAAAKAEAERKAKEEKAQKQAAEAKKEEQTLPGAESSVGSGESDAALPQAGPVETIGAIVALSLLSIASISYVRSRRLQLPL